MKQRIIGVFLVLCALLTLLPTAAASETEVTYAVEGGNIYFDKSTGTITDCDDTVTSATIPSEIDGVAVKKIGKEAFYDCRELESVTISYGVTSLGENAFCGCSSLKDVVLPNSLTTLTWYAFQNCSALQSIAIPESVEKIGICVFGGCSSLKGIWVDEKNPYFSNDAAGALLNKEQTELLSVPGGLTQYVIPDSVSSIGEEAFDRCCNLVNITIPGNMTNIGDGAFFGCSSLVGIWVEQSNRYYCSDTFGVLFDKEMTELIQAPGAISGEYVIPDGVTSIESQAFWNCSSLTAVTIPNSVTSIDSYAFHSCSSLTAVTIPSSITSIGHGTFSWCVNLKTVTIPESVTIIDENAFRSCDCLTNVYFLGDAPSIDDSAFQTWDYQSGEYYTISGLTLYYIEGKSGWTSPEWNGYSTATWDGVNYPELPVEEEPEPVTDDFEPEETEPDYTIINGNISGDLPESIEGSYTVIFTPNSAEQITGEIVYVGTPTLPERLKMRRSLLSDETETILLVVIYAAPLIVVLWLLIFVIFGKRKFSCLVASILLWVLVLSVALRVWLADGNCLLVCAIGLPLQLLLIVVWCISRRGKKKQTALSEDDAATAESVQPVLPQQPTAPQAQWPMNQEPTAPQAQWSMNQQPTAPQAQWPMNQQPTAPQAQWPMNQQPTAPQAQWPMNQQPTAPQAQWPMNQQPTQPAYPQQPTYPQSQWPMNRQPTAPQAQWPMNQEPTAPLQPIDPHNP